MSTDAPTHLDLPISGHDVRVVRGARREAAQPPRRRRGDGELRDRARDRRLRRPRSRRPTTSSPRSSRPATAPSCRPRAGAGAGARPRPGRATCAARLIFSAVRVGAAAAARDDPGAAVRQLAVAVDAARDAGRWSGPPGRFTAPRGRTCATARRRWTRSSRSARSPPGRGRSSRCCSSVPATPGMRHTLSLVPRARRARGQRLLRGRRRRRDVPARRALLRGARQAPRRRRAARAARARRQGRRGARRRRRRAARRRSSS